MMDKALVCSPNGWSAAFSMAVAGGWRGDDLPRAAWLFAGRYRLAGTVKNVAPTGRRLMFLPHEYYRSGAGREAAMFAGHDADLSRAA